MNSKCIYILLLSIIICFSKGHAQFDRGPSRELLEKDLKEINQKIKQTENDLENQKNDFTQLKMRFNEIEAIWKTLPPGKEKNKLEAELHALDDKRPIFKGNIERLIKDLVELRDGSEKIKEQIDKYPNGGGGRNSYVVIVAITITIVSITIALISLSKNRRKPSLPAQTHPTPGPERGDSPHHSPINPVVLAAIITAVASIIVALIDLIKKY